MRKNLGLLAVAFCLTATAQNSSTFAPRSQIYITHVTVIDTETGKEATDQTVLIADGKIADVANSENLAVPASARNVDGRGKYLIPGLWDMHVHTWDYESTYPLYIANGVTGVRDMFGPPDANNFRAEFNKRQLIAPHFYLASPVVDGHPAVWPNSIEVTTPEQGRKVVDDQQQKGVDFIKVYSRLTPDAYFAIAAESARVGIPFEGHVPNDVSAWKASDAKQKSFEHLYGIPIACSTREEELQAKMLQTTTMKERQVLAAAGARSYSESRCNLLFARLTANNNWQVPTLTALRPKNWSDPQFSQDARLHYFSGEYRDWLMAKHDSPSKGWASQDRELETQQFEFDKKLVGAMFRAGVPILAGTDSGNPFCFPGFSLHDELALLVEAGLTPLAALQSATRNAAVFMNATDSYGSIAPGKIADLVLLDADPLQDIHNTTKIRAVFLAGKEFDRAALDSILRRAEAAANHATNTADESQQSEEAQGLKMPGSSASATDSSNGSAETELRAFMAELRKASIEGDVDTIANSMTDDYVQTDINGYRQDKATWLNEYFRPLADLIKAGKFHWDEYERTNLQFRFYGNCAVVTGDLHAKGTGAKSGPQHTWVPDPNATFSGTLHFTHVYVKQNGKWTLAALHNQMPLPTANSAK